MTNSVANATSFKPGNTVSADGRRWHQAIKQAALKRHGRSKQTMLEAAADTLVQMAVDGDIGALKEVGNRLDGMAHQSVSVDNTGNNRSITVQLSFVKPADQLAHEQPLAVTHTPVTIEHDTVDAADAVPVTPQADE